ESQAPRADGTVIAPFVARMVNARNEARILGDREEAGVESHGLASCARGGLFEMAPDFARGPENRADSAHRPRPPDRAYLRAAAATDSRAQRARSSGLSRMSSGTG